MGEPPALESEVQGAGSGLDGAGAADLGGHRGAGGGAGRASAAVARATGIAYSTIRRGLKELAVGGERGTRARAAPGRRAQAHAGQRSDPAGGSRGVGGADRLGRSAVAAALDLEECAPVGREPCSGMGHAVSRQLVAELLAAAGYSLQANRKTREGTHASGPRRAVPLHHPAGPPVPSGDPARHLRRYEEEGTGGGLQERRAPSGARRGSPTPVRVHDFLIPASRARPFPYGVYDLTRNAGWVSVGIDHDTASFAVRTIRRWWQKMGRPRYPRARSLLITADAGGSNGPRVRLWKWELQQLANSHRPGDHRVSLPAGHQQVEQDRAPAVLLHQHELARAAPGESGRDRQPDRRHAHRGRAARAL